MGQIISNVRDKRAYLKQINSKEGMKREKVNKEQNRKETARCQI